jgi:hypothetical protein
MIDIFKVGVHVGMTTNASQVLATMLRELTGVHVKAGELAASLDNIKAAALGAGEIFVGWEVGKAIWHAIEGNRELNAQLEKTKQLGGEFAANLDKTRAAAFRTANDAPTSVVADNVRMAREIGATLGHPEAAGDMLTEATKVAYLAHNYTGETEEDIVKNLIRVADLRGQIYTTGADGQEHVDPAKLQAELNAAYKALVLGGGFVTSGGLFQMAKQGGAVAKEQTPEAFYAAGTEAAVAMGASRVGTAETSLMAQFIGGTMTAKVAEHLTEAGLLHSDEWRSDHGHVVVDPKAARRFEPMMQDPIAWLENGEGGQAIKAYAMKESIPITAAIMQLFGRATTQRLASDAMSNEPQFARAREIYGNITDVQSAYKELHDNDLGTNLTEIASAWKSFMQAFSDAGTPLVIPFLHGLTDVIHLLMDGVANYPKLTEGLIGLAAGLAGLTVLGGALTILNLCWSPLATGLKMLTAQSATYGPTASGLSGIAGALVGLSAAAGLAYGVKSAADAGTKSLYDKIFGAGHWDTAHDDMSQNPIAKFLGLNSGTSAVAPGSASQSKPTGPVPVVVTNGRDLASGVADHMADQATKPQSGTTQPDIRIDPWSAGLANFN